MCSLPLFREGVCFSLRERTKLRRDLLIGSVGALMRWVYGHNCNFNVHEQYQTAQNAEVADISRRSRRLSAGHSIAVIESAEKTHPRAMTWPR